jgi:ZIP family zinc transporter
MTFVVIAVVSGSLILGAAWGIYGTLPDRVEGLIVALAGGALMISAVLELIEPATRVAPFWAVSALVLTGAAVFAALDHVIDQRGESDSGGGLLAAITLDGIPENLALGVALISTGPVGAAALSGSILLSNLPEAAGGAREMTGGGRSKRAVLGLWTATAVLLTAAALAGNLLLAGASVSTLGLMRSFAGGAVVGSLALEVFPKAFKESGYSTGLAVALGLVLALFLDGLG